MRDEGGKRREMGRGRKMNGNLKGNEREGEEKRENCTGKKGKSREVEENARDG